MHCVEVHTTGTERARWLSSYVQGCRLCSRIHIHTYTFRFFSHTYVNTRAGIQLDCSPRKMNCPSRVDPIVPDGWNQNPNALNAEATTRADMSRLADARMRRDHRMEGCTDGGVVEVVERAEEEKGGEGGKGEGEGRGVEGGGGKRGGWGVRDGIKRGIKRVGVVLRRYAKFVGPGFMVAVAYIDPGRWSDFFASYGGECTAASMGKTCFLRTHIHPVSKPIPILETTC